MRSLVNQELLPSCPPLSLSLPPPSRTIVPMEYMGEEYFKMKATVIKYERFLLKVRAAPACSLVSTSTIQENLCLSLARNWGSVSMSNTHTR